MKPILFNTEMVRAILENRKTVTRRVVKPQPAKWQHAECSCNGTKFFFSSALEAKEYRPPYLPGDILYVRETWNTLIGDLIYRADQKPEFKNPGKWRPSIHMPREAARIFLRVMDVRVERLRHISDTACMAEGITCAWNVDLPDAFAEMWDSTIKPADRTLYGWDANPWVWVIEFERTEKP